MDWIEKILGRPKEFNETAVGEFVKGVRPKKPKRKFNRYAVDVVKKTKVRLS